MLRILLITCLVLLLSKTAIAQCGGLASYYNVKVCEGATFYTAYGSPPGSTWVWTGPNGFYSTNPLLEIKNFQQKDVGFYQSCVTRPGCSTPACAVNELVISLKKRTDITASVCPGSAYTFPSGKTLSNTVANTTYLDTSILASTEIDERRNYCDSVIYTALNVKDVSKTILNEKICTGKAYTLPDGRIISTPGNYQFTFNLKSAAGCDSTVQLTLNIGDAYKSVTDIVICKNQQYVLPDGRTVSATGEYTSVLSSISGCDSVLITKLTKVIGSGDNVFLPTAFSPNGDGINDIFKAIKINQSQFGHLKIYNRWGQLIFSSTDFLKGWDGSFNNQLAQTGSYVYLLRAKNCEGVWQNYKGTITILR